MAVAAVVGVALAAGASAFGAGVAVAVAVGVAGAAIYTALSVKTPGVTSSASTQSERKQLIRSGTAPKQVLLGESLCSGVWLYGEEQTGDSKNSDGTYKEWLYCAFGISDHSIQEVSQTYLDETKIEEFGDYANYEIHIDPQETDSYLLSNAPSWKSDMIGKGTTWARVAMLFNNDKYSSGIPTPRFLFKGANTIYDPRTETTGYTNNAALVILWVLRKYMGFSDSEIIWTGFGGFKEAANLCDESVTNPDGSSEKRYTINGSFELDEKRGDILSDLLDCCGGEFVRIGGKIGLLPAAYYGPATYTIHESDVIGSVDIQPEISRSNAINTVGGTFVDPDQFYSETDYPVISDNDAIEADGGELKRDLNFRFITSPYQCQRLANIQLNRAKAGAIIKLTMNLNGLHCRRGRVVNLSLSQLNIAGEFRVVDMDYHLSKGVELTLHQESIDIYDDSVGQTFESPSLTDSTVGGILSPANLQFYTESYGDVVQGTLSWTTLSSSAVVNDIKIEKQESDSSLTTVQVGQSPGNSYQVTGLSVASYVASVRSRTATGKTSAWVSYSFSVKAPSAPSSVEVTQSNWSIQLLPQFTEAVAVGTLFEFWYLADTTSALTGEPSYSESDRGIAKKIHTGSSLHQSGLVPDRYQHYWVRTVNLYGKSDFVYVQTNTTREQDLVTTVVERLESVEIVSSNYVEGESGYKLSKAGDVEFNSGVFRGTVVLNDVEGGLGSLYEQRSRGRIKVGAISANTEQEISIFEFKFKRQSFARRFLIELQFTPKILSTTNYSNSLSYDYLFSRVSGVSAIPYVLPLSSQSTDGNSFNSLSGIENFLVNGRYSSTNSETRFDRLNNLYWSGTINASEEEGTDSVTIKVKFKNPTSSAIDTLYFLAPSVRVDVIKSFDDDDIDVSW